jgi:hypothetical protein
MVLWSQVQKMQDALKGTRSEKDLVKAWKAMRSQLVAEKAADVGEGNSSQQPQSASAAPVEAAAEAGAIDQAAEVARNVLADALKDFVRGDTTSSALRPKVTNGTHLF